MKRRLIPFKLLGMLTITILSLSLTLSATKCYAQSTKKTDSTFATIEGTQAEIDSALKILNDYPDLKSQYEATKSVLSKERRVSNIEREAILEVLDLPDWDYEEVVKRIRKIKRQLFWKPILYGSGGAGIGFAMGFILSRFL